MSDVPRDVAREIAEEEWRHAKRGCWSLLFAALLVSMSLVGLISSCAHGDL